MPSINVALRWAIDIANDDTHGYSQANRYGPDYDCSSFIAAALINGGFNVPATMYTGNERSALLNAGFREISVDAPRRAGDIFLVHETTGEMFQHTLMCVDANRVVEAYGDYGHPQTGDQNGKEIRIGNFYYLNWQHHFRYGNDIVIDPVWHNKPTGAYDRTSYEAQDNAVMTYQVLSAKGWTLQAVSGLLGNIEVESGYNPWRWQGDIVLSSTDTEAMQSSAHGYGLLQYTPASKYNLSSYAHGLRGFGPNYSNVSGSTNDGTAQLIFCNNSEGYYPTTQYPMTYDDYKRSTADAADLATVWLYNYERPLDPSATVNARREAATYWYNVLKNVDLVVHKTMPVWMMLRNNRRG